ncbi:MAG TPA: hypothetical protein VGJ44_24420 [Kribbellaceae bacterium]|jgi:hypothetical protein
MVDANMLDIGRAMASVRSDVVYPGHPSIPDIARDALDDMWIPIAGRLGLVVLSRDKRLRYKPVERRALVAHAVRVVNLTSSNNLSSWDRLTLITRHWQRIEMRARTPGPWLLALSQNGLREASLD